PDLDPAEGPRRSAHHADRLPAEGRHALRADRPAGCHLRPRRLRVGAEARMRSFRSLLILVALLGGLLAYLYFVDAKKPVEQAEEKPKVFAGVESDKIDELKVSTVAGSVTS